VSGFGFEVTADVFLELPQCEALATSVKCDLYGSAFMEEQAQCTCKATRFYLIDGQTESCGPWPGASGIP